MLKRLIREQIDPDPQVREKMVSALLIGSSAVAVPTGKSAKAVTSPNTPICTGKNQVGCVISLCVPSGKAPTDSLGPVRWHRAGCPVQTACTNPAALKGGLPRIDLWYRASRSPVCWAPLRGSCTAVPAEGQDRVVDAEGPVPRQVHDEERRQCTDGQAGGQEVQRNSSVPQPRLRSSPHGHKPALGDLIDLVRSQKKRTPSAKARVLAPPSALWLPVGSEADSGPFRVVAGSAPAPCGARHSILVSSVTRKCV